MPIGNVNDYLYDGQPGTDSPVAKHVGAGPIGGMLLRLSAAAGATGDAHASVALGECDTAGGTYTDVPLGNRDPITMDATPGANEYDYAEQRVFWTKRYLLIELGDTPAGTAATDKITVSLLQGDIPRPKAGKDA